EEQHHWKQYNEEPHGSISRRAFLTDFAAQLPDETKPLEELREVLRMFPSATQNGVATPIWRLRDPVLERSLWRLQPVVTDQQQEWKDAGLELAKMVVDGLEKRPLRRLAEALGRGDAAELRSIKLLDACLREQGVAPDVVDAVCGPLHSLWQARSTTGTAH